MTARLTSPFLARVLGVGLLAACGCSSDLAAPDCYNDGLGAVPRCQITGADFETEGATTQTTATGAGPLQLSCAAPAGAVGAGYQYQPLLQGAEGSVVWMASGLPPELQQDPSTGAIRGIPTEPADVTLTISALDQAGNAASASCGFVIQAALAIELSPLLEEVPGCIQPGESLVEYLVPGTGDGTPLLCDTPTGPGDGKRPPGVTVDPTTCALQGEIDEYGIGTWVFMVRARQSGREVYAPYCVTDATAEEGAYEITVEHSGLDPEQDDATFMPMVRRYDPSETYVVGGNDDPLFRIIDPDACGDGCAFRYQFGLSASFFDRATLSLAPERIVLDPQTRMSVGFSHNLLISGPGDLAIDPAVLASRPWVLNAAFDYCMSSDLADCADDEQNFANPNGHLEFAVIMVGNEGS